MMYMPGEMEASDIPDELKKDIQSMETRESSIGTDIHKTHFESMSVEELIHSKINMDVLWKEIEDYPRTSEAIDKLTTQMRSLEAQVSEAKRKFIKGNPFSTTFPQEIQYSQQLIDMLDAKIHNRTRLQQHIHRITENARETINP